MIYQSFFWGMSERIESRALKYLHTLVHSSIILNIQELEASQVSTSRWVYKQNVVYYIQFSLQKDRYSDT
jgi:hypothetical protein